MSMGTLIDITAYIQRNDLNVTRVFDLIEEDFALMHTAFHPWEPGSLQRTNILLATGSPFSLPLSVKLMIEQSQVYERQSLGYFNPAVGKLIALWGFSQPPFKPIVPDTLAINDLMNPRPSMAQIRIDGIRGQTHNPNIKIDLGGIAKGHAVDLAMKRLREAGIDHAIVNAGGDLRAIGQKPDSPWRVAIRDPRRKQRPLAIISIQGDESVFTSGNYERFFEVDGKRYTHIIDPFSGFPVDNMRSVTVISDLGIHADVAATALFVAGKAKWRDVARSMGIKQVMMITGDNEILISSAMQQRLEWIGRHDYQLADPVSL